MSEPFHFGASRHAPLAVIKAQACELGMLAVAARELAIL
jgi:hypothetical protein